MSLWRQLRDRRGIGRALGNLGQIARVRGDYDRAAAVFRESLALFQEIGDKRGIALCFERLGGVASDQRHSKQAAQLFGASDVLREAIGVAPAASDRPVYEFGGTEDRDAVRAEMGDDAFEAARAEGRTMTLEQALEYALGSPD